MKCIILVGGAGERLWPISRDLYPKSMLKLHERKSFLQNAFDMAKSVVSPKNVIAIANIKHSSDIKIKLKELSTNPLVISEPIAKNTAAAVAASVTFFDGEKDDILAFIPCDFTVKDEDAFITALNKAKSLATLGYITAIGVKPLYPETGYGYIKAGENLKKGRKISEFKEKPSLKSAEKYVKEKDYFWNTGIYVAKISVWKDAFNKYAPQIIGGMSKNMFDEYNKIQYSVYDKIPNLSVDYAVIEKTDNMAMVELETQWLDFGSWESVYDNSKKDKEKNVIKGNVLIDNVKNSFIYSTKELVAVSDIKDTVIIETEDAVLVCDKNKTQDINEIVKTLKNNKSEEALFHKTVYRPWGYYTCLNSGKGWLTKVITVSAGQKLSVQSHNHRSEHWVVLEGNATVILDGETHELKKRQSINIPVKAKHSLQNHSKEPLRILEVQKGEHISEDDIIRYEDMYGRA